MSIENTAPEMTIEKLNIKLKNQSALMKELTTENEELFHQYNHLMIRNNKLLKRIDDLHKIIDDLHIRIEELQLINGNMMQLNDKLRRKSGNNISFESPLTSNDPIKEISISEGLDLEELFLRWKNFPAQSAQNAPTLRKQVIMLAHLYSTDALSAADLFSRAGVGGVTGARYVATLKKLNLIRYIGARKKGKYEITRKGIEFVENQRFSSNDVKIEGPVDNRLNFKEAAIREPLRSSVFGTDHSGL